MTAVIRKRSAAAEGCSTRPADSWPRLHRRQLHRNWENFADTFPATPYLTGRQPGALDYLAVVVTKWASTRSHLAKTRPGFRQTLLSIEKHESAMDVFKEHWSK